MIIRCLHPSPFLHFTTTNSSFRPNLLTAGAPGKLRNKVGIHLNVRSLRSSSSDNVLSAKEDNHGGVTVEMSTDPIDPILFTSLLKSSIQHWKQQGKKGVWIKLPIELVNLIEPAVKEGFYYHHAEPTYLMLVHWIPVTDNTLPPNATHRVGVGAFVMKENGEVLVVQEKGGKMRGTGIWKFPTGVVEEGEDICDAVVREVKEETGIDAKFVEILAFRQSHKKFFNKSDLFFMCMLEPISFDIQKQEREIEAAQPGTLGCYVSANDWSGKSMFLLKGQKSKGHVSVFWWFFLKKARTKLASALWMAFEEYTSQPFVQKHDLPKYVAEICLAKRNKRYTGFSFVSTLTSFSKSQSNLYFNTTNFNSS